MSLQLVCHVYTGTTHVSRIYILVHVQHYHDVSCSVRSCYLKLERHMYMYIRDLDCVTGHVIIGPCPVSRTRTCFLVHYL